MKKSKTKNKPVHFYLSIELITLIILIALLFVCIMEKQIIKANWNTFLMTLENGLRQWTISSGDLLN